MMDGKAPEECATCGSTDPATDGYPPGAPRSEGGWEGLPLCPDDFHGDE